MYEELVSRLRRCASYDPRIVIQDCSAAADAIEELQAQLMYSNDAAKAIADKVPKWIPVTERLPKCEQEVMICTEKKLVGKDAYIDSIVTPAIYEDGTMPECDSIWNWVDIDYSGWDEENDCGIIPEGWWENRHFNPDEVYNNPVDRKVVAWMPLPDPYKPKEEDEDGCKSNGGCCGCQCSLDWLREEA